MQQFPFENSDIVLYEDGPFAEYLRNTSQRLDNVRYENYQHALNELSNQDEQISQIEYENDDEMKQEINDIQAAIKQKEYKKCLLILYVVIPCIIQPITKHQSTINDVISDFSYNIDNKIIHQIYASLYSYFHDSDNDNDDQQDDDNQDTKHTLFTTSLIISNKYLLFFTLLLHSITILILLWSNITMIAIIVEMINMMFIIIDIIEYYQWICFFNGVYELIYYLTQFQSFVDKSFKILNNVTAITNGYSLHHQFIASHKIEQKNSNQTNIHLINLRLQLQHSLLDINQCLYQMTSLIANNPKNKKEIESNKEKLMLKDLLLLYKQFRIHQKILFTQLYRISSPLIYCNKLCKSIRGIWFKGIIFTQRQDNNELDHFIHYINSPFSPHQLHFNLSISNLLQCVYQSFCMLYQHNVGRATNKTNVYPVINKFHSLNNSVLGLTKKFRNANIALFAELRLSKKAKNLSRFSTSKVINEKKENLHKIDGKMDNDRDKHALNEIYNHLHRLQNRMDEMTSQIYLMHEQCIENPENIMVKSKIESKYDDDNDDDIDIQDEIEQYKSLEIMRDIMLGLNRTFNEWKFIVSKINPHSKLLEKYKNIGFGNQGLISSNKYRYHQELENVIQDDSFIDDDDDEKAMSFKDEQQNIMSGLFAKLNKQRAKMSITEDGEELYEPTEEAKRSLKAKVQKDNNGNNEDLLSASMVKPGSGISIMDKYNMVDELKNVLKTRKQAAIKKFQKQRTTNKDATNNEEENETKDENDKNCMEKKEDIDEEEMKYNMMNKMEAMRNIRGSYPTEEVIENYYSEGSSDDEEDDEETVTEQQEKRFLMELNRLGLGSGAFVTTRTNTEIQSFGYDRQQDKNTMSLFAVLQGQNKKEMKSVLNGTAHDMEVEFKMNNNEIEKEEKEELDEIEEDEENEKQINYESELQKSFQDTRSDDDGGTLADELSGLMQ